MDREEALKVLEMFLHKQCDLGRTKFAYDQNIVWDAVDMAAEALKEQQELADATNEIYAKGYNAAKREIALSAEYERAYKRGVKDAQEWIPCDDRLPKVGARCFLRYSNGKISGGSYIGNHTWSVDYNDADVSVIVSDWLQFNVESEEDANE